MAKRATMTFHTSPEVKARMERLAAITKRSKSYLANEAVERYLAAEEDFIAAVNDGIADADAGRVYTGQEIRTRVAARVADVTSGRSAE